MFTFFSKDTLNIKSNRYLQCYTTFLCQKKLFFWTLFNVKFLETKVSWFFIQILSSTTVFNIDLFEQQIKILEWFLKDHVTLKTRVMAAENSALQRKKFFKSFIQINKKTPNIWPNWKLTYPMLSNFVSEPFVKLEVFTARGKCSKVNNKGKWSTIQQHR